MLYGVVVGRQVIRVAVRFSSRISESLGFGVSHHICWTNKARPEEDRSVVTVWELTDRPLSVCVCVCV